MSQAELPKCLCCSDFFTPDYRHRRDQRCCSKPTCKRARQAASLKRWRAKPENRDFWRGDWNVNRVQEWRAAHPGYWKRARKRKQAPLQNAMKSLQVAELGASSTAEARDCVTKRVPELLKSESPVVVGLIAALTGDTLQNAIAETTARLFERGRAVMGL